MPKTKYWALYQDHVCSAAIRVARELFHLLPIARTYVHVAAEMLNTATGHSGPETVLSVEFDRDRLLGLNFDRIDASDAVESFRHAMNFKKTAGFSPVETLQHLTQLTSLSNETPSAGGAEWSMASANAPGREPIWHPSMADYGKQSLLFRRAGVRREGKGARPAKQTPSAARAWLLAAESVRLDETRSHGSRIHIVRAWLLAAESRVHVVRAWLLAAESRIHVVRAWPLATESPVHLARTWLLATESRLLAARGFMLDTQSSTIAANASIDAARAHEIAESTWGRVTAARQHIAHTLPNAQRDRGPPQRRNRAVRRRSRSAAPGVGGS